MAVRRPGDRRRYATAYACSILIHIGALIVVVLFVVRAILNGSAPDAAFAPDTTISVTPPSPPPTAAPVVRPQRTPRPVAPRPVAHRPVPPPPPQHHELAVNVKNATPQPSAAPIPTAPPATPEPRRVASLPAPIPTPAPTAPPTAPPTVVPSAPPTVVPTERPTPEPTLPPTPAPTVAPTAPPTVRPTREPTAAPTAAPTARATQAPAAVPVARGAAPATGGVTSHAAVPGSAPASPAAAHAVAAPATAAPEPAQTESPALAALNARMKALLPTGAAGGSMAAVDMGTYHTDRVLDAYEASLAPPLEILLKTFGLIYTKRTAGQADSVAYVYERTRILGVEVCKAYTIVEHPLRVAGPNGDHIGPVAAPTLPGPLRDLKPEITTEVVPCNAKGMIPVVPGSLTSPVPRRRE